MSRISNDGELSPERREQEWSSGIELELQRREVISSTSEAMHALTELWPPRRKCGVREAIDICAANLAGKATAHECKRALLRAALLSNVEINRLWVRKKNSDR